MNVLVEGSFLSLPTAMWIGILIEMISKGTVLLGLAYLLARLLPTTSARFRSRSWTVVFILLAAIPVVSSALQMLDKHSEYNLVGAISSPVQIVPTFTAPVTQGNINNFSTATGSTAAAVTSVSKDLTKPEFFPNQGSSQKHFEFRNARMAIVLWLIGAIVICLRTTKRFRNGLQLTRNVSLVKSGLTVDLVEQISKEYLLRQDIKIGLSQQVFIPFISGQRQLTLVLPESSKTWPTERLSAVLRHELAHVKRNDLSRLVLVDIACAFNWFNPLIWLGARRIKLDIEMACDEFACSGGGRCIEYARQLLWFATQAHLEQHPQLVPGMARQPGVELRIRNILDTHEKTTVSVNRKIWTRSVRRFCAIATGLLCLTVLLPLTIVRSLPSVDHDVSETISPALTTADSILLVEPELAVAGNLHQLAAKGDIADVKSILQNNPLLLETKDEKGFTPMAVAAWNDQLEMMKYLIHLGADINPRNDNGLTPLFCAVDRTRIKTAALLLYLGADQTISGYRGRSLLHMAARTGNPWLVSTLLRHGANVNAADNIGASALDIAHWHRHLPIAQLLVDHGATANGIPRPNFLNPTWQKDLLTDSRINVL